MIGPYPPPYGGVSIHIKRLITIIDKNCIKTKIINKSFKSFFIKMFFIKKGIYHIHLTGWKTIVMLGILSICRKKIILTLHSINFDKEYKQSNKLLKKILRWSMKQIPIIVCVNEQIKKGCLMLGVLEKHLKVISPYINPMIIKNEYNNIDKSLWNFIEKKQKNNYRILTANGNIRFYNNEDLYGLDLLIEMLYKLKQDNYKAALVFALLGYNNQTKQEREYFNCLLERIKKYHLTADIYIYKVENTEYYPILDKSDIFIRPTNTDGDAISLREAIYLKKPNIASEASLRPAETILFKNRNVNELFNKTKYVLENYDIEKEKLDKIIIKENYNEILEIYRKLS